ncbi:MAG: hydantoinase/carbamoylase family amidase [Bacilli bacterium]
MPESQTIQCDSKRFLSHFTEVSQIGSTADGGVNRPFGSAADLQLRAWLTQRMGAAGLQVEVDAIGNIWGMTAGSVSLPAIVLGSHHDSVPFGGRFDGPLGVLAALEVVQTLQESGYRNRRPLGIVSFTAEEPNPFDISTMGSRTVAGRLTAQQLLAAHDGNGRSLELAIAQAGGDLRKLSGVRKTDWDLFAFLELHIEQGRRLESAGMPAGVVTGICGIYREQVSVAGEANHAGTTRLADRRDALLAGSELALGVERLLLDRLSWRSRATNNREENAPAAIFRDRPEEELIATVGRFTITPNAPNIIPGQCDFTVEIRGASSSAIHSLAAAFGALAKQIGVARGVQIARTVLLDQAPAAMDDTVVDTLRSAAAALQIPFRDLFSMAGHDATHIASFTKAGMLFVPSIGGRSHCKEEETRMDDIASALAILLETTLRLDRIDLHGERTERQS